MKSRKSKHRAQLLYVDFVVFMVIISIMLSSWGCGNAHAPTPKSTYISSNQTSNVTVAESGVGTTPKQTIKPPVQPPSSTSNAEPATPSLSNEPEHGEWVEDWSTAQVGSYCPSMKGAIAYIKSHRDEFTGEETFIKANLGSWIVLDTAVMCFMGADEAVLSELPADAPEFTTHTAEIVQGSGGKYLSLNVPAYGVERDDLWVILEKPSSDYPILKPTTTITFEASGKIDNDKPYGGYIALCFGKDTGDLFYYTIYESKMPREPHKISLGGEGIYTRNVYEDYISVYHGKPYNFKLKPFILIVGIGHAEFYRITIKW